MVGISQARRARIQGIVALIVGILFAIIGITLIGLYVQYLDPRGSIPLAFFLAISPMVFLGFGVWGMYIGLSQYIEARRIIRRYPRYM